MKALGPLVLLGLLGIAGCQSRPISHSDTNAARASLDASLKRNGAFWKPGLTAFFNKVVPDFVGPITAAPPIIGKSTDAFYEATDERDLSKRLDKLRIPSDAAAILLALRFGDACRAMAVAPADYVPSPQDFDAYYKEVAQCWNEGHDAPTQLAAAKRFFTLYSAQIADLRKQLDLANSKLSSADIPQ